MNILQAIDDPNLFKPWFKNAESWRAWRVFLKALFGLPMSAEEASALHSLTGRTEAPTAQFSEAWLVMVAGVARASSRPL